MPKIVDFESVYDPKSVNYTGKLYWDDNPSSWYVADTGIKNLNPDRNILFSKISTSGAGYGNLGGDNIYGGAKFKKDDEKHNLNIITSQITAAVSSYENCPVFLDEGNHDVGIGDLELKVKDKARSTGDPGQETIAAEYFLPGTEKSSKLPSITIGDKKFPKVMKLGPYYVIYHYNNKTKKLLGADIHVNTNTLPYDQTQIDWLKKVLKEINEEAEASNKEINEEAKKANNSDIFIGIYGHHAPIPGKHKDDANVYLKYAEKRAKALKKRAELFKKEAEKFETTATKMEGKDEAEEKKAGANALREVAEQQREKARAVGSMELSQDYQSKEALQERLQKIEEDKKIPNQLIATTLTKEKETTEIQTAKNALKKQLEEANQTKEKLEKKLEETDESAKTTKVLQEKLNETNQAKLKELFLNDLSSQNARVALVWFEIFEYMQDNDLNLVNPLNMISHSGHQHSYDLYTDEKMLVVRNGAGNSESQTTPEPISEQWKKNNFPHCSFHGRFAYSSTVHDGNKIEIKSFAIENGGQFCAASTSITWENNTQNITTIDFYRGDEIVTQRRNDHFEVKRNSYIETALNNATPEQKHEIFDLYVKAIIGEIQKQIDRMPDCYKRKLLNNYVTEAYKNHKNGILKKLNAKESSDYFVFTEASELLFSEEIGTCICKKKPCTCDKYTLKKLLQLNRFYTLKKNMYSENARSYVHIQHQRTPLLEKIINDYAQEKEEFTLFTLVENLEIAVLELIDQKAKEFRQVSLLFRENLSTEDNRENFESNAAYICTEEKLFYVNKADKTLTEINTSRETIEAFKKAFKPEEKPRSLSINELNQISSMTKHKRKSYQNTYAKSYEEARKLYIPKYQTAKKTRFSSNHLADFERVNSYIDLLKKNIKELEEKREENKKSEHTPLFWNHNETSWKEHVENHYQEKIKFLEEKIKTLEEFRDGNTDEQLNLRTLNEKIEKIKYDAYRDKRLRTCVYDDICISSLARLGFWKTGTQHLVIDSSNSFQKERCQPQKSIPSVIKALDAIY